MFGAWHMLIMLQNQKQLGDMGIHNERFPGIQVMHNSNQFPGRNVWPSFNVVSLWYVLQRNGMKCWWVIFILTLWWKHCLESSFWYSWCTWRGIMYYYCYNNNCKNEFASIQWKLYITKVIVTIFFTKYCIYLCIWVNDTLIMNANTMIILSINSFYWITWKVASFLQEIRSRS